MSRRLAPSSAPDLSSPRLVGLGLPPTWEGDSATAVPRRRGMYAAGSGELLPDGDADSGSRVNARRRASTRAGPHAGSWVCCAPQNLVGHLGDLWTRISIRQHPVVARRGPLDDARGAAHEALDGVAGSPGVVRRCPSTAERSKSTRYRPISSWPQRAKKKSPGETGAFIEAPHSLLCTNRSLGAYLAASTAVALSSQERAPAIPGG